MSLTADQFARHDRNIRVYGLDGQKKILKSKVQIIGITDTAHEITKNLVLAGFAEISLYDTHQSNGIYFSMKEIKSMNADSQVNIKLNDSDALIKEIKTKESDLLIINISGQPFLNELINHLEAVSKPFIIVSLGFDYGIFMNNFHCHPTSIKLSGDEIKHKEILFSSIAVLLNPKTDYILQMDNCSKKRRLKIAEETWPKLKTALQNVSETNEENSSDFSAGHIGIVSIIGSLVSQEITKAITNTQDPVNNGCFFDAENLETACFMLKEETIFMQ